jgi:hypothetical protein
VIPSPAQYGKESGVIPGDTRNLKEIASLKLTMIVMVTENQKPFQCLGFQGKEGNTYVLSLDI